MLSKKYRPTKFSDIVGQDGLVMELRETSKTLSYPKNIMLFGPTGSGKTTVAYLISALLNDPNPIIHEDGTKDPNMESDSTKAIFEEKFNRDVSFHDASGMDKEGIIKLENLLSAAPMFDKNRIVIIDEAQELSRGGKGATLRLLEKKREGVYVILCTMNPQSFDDAVKSRCVCYKFRQLSSHFNAMNLYGILKREGIDKEVPDVFINEGIFAIADCAEGSARTAIQLLERAIAGKIYTEDALVKELGAYSNKTLSSMVRRLLEKDGTLLKDIKLGDPQSFYYKSEKVIQDAMIYKLCGYVDLDWKKNLYNGIKDHVNFKELATTYKDIRANMRYFYETVFYFYLIEYLNKKPPVIKRRVVKK